MGAVFFVGFGRCWGGKMEYSPSFPEKTSLRDAKEQVSSGLVLPPKRKNRNGGSDLIE